MDESGKIEASVRAFCAAAIEKGDYAFPAERDHELHASMKAAMKTLRSLGTLGVTALRNLLRHESAHVRNWVAAELLASGDKAAKPVLEALAKGDGLLATSAKVVLEEYEAGRLLSPFGTDVA